ncbi:hypothetical protein CDW43_16225 (plasmid) [Methylophaga nitratireducenticrescens]|nr:hypothetical protein CDW43_16225 [Methylophaga nitratireducenticrescens]
MGAAAPNLKLKRPVLAVSNGKSLCLIDIGENHRFHDFFASFQVIMGHSELLAANGLFNKEVPPSRRVTSLSLICKPK